MLLLFVELLFLKKIYCIRCRFFSTITRFWPYLLLKFLPMFFAKDKNPYPFSYILSLGSIEYLIFIRWNRVCGCFVLLQKLNLFCVLFLMVHYFDLWTIFQWFKILSWVFLKRYDLREKFLINYQTVCLEQTFIRLLNLVDNITMN